VKTIIFLLLVCAACASVPPSQEGIRPEPGEWVNVGTEGKIMVRCCDCGLTHVFEIKRDDNGVYWFRGWVDSQETEAWRRVNLVGGELPICRVCRGSLDFPGWPGADR